MSDLLARLEQRPPKLCAHGYGNICPYGCRVETERTEFDRDLALDALAEALEWFDEETPKDTVQTWLLILATLRKPTPRQEGV